MPGFLIFEEFGMDFSSMPGLAAAAIKGALRRVPGTWMMHGVIGESGVNVDPIAELNATLNGGGTLGSMANTAQDTATSAATGDAAGVVEGAASLANTFFDPYKGWIPVLGISQTVASTAEESKRSLKDEVNGINDAISRATSLQPKSTSSGRVTQPLEPETPKKWVTGMSGNSDRGVERLQVEVMLDVSFPNLLKMALKPHRVMGEDKGIRKRSSAEIHLCTTAAVDMSAVTLGSDSPAARMIQTLLSFNLQNIVPYLTIQLSDVWIAEVEYSLNGDSEDSTPSASIELEYEKIKWTYHVLNGSNMNLFDVDFTYDIKERRPPSSGFSIGKMLNPFA